MSTEADPVWWLKGSFTCCVTCIRYFGMLMYVKARDFFFLSEISHFILHFKCQLKFPLFFTLTYFFSLFLFTSFFIIILPYLLRLPAADPAAKEAEVPRRFSLTSSLASSASSSFATRRTKGT